MGAALVLWASRPGPGLSPDSLKYLLLARAVAHGDGFALFGEPEIHFPPLYPWLLALVGAVDPASLARAGVLQAALLAVNVLLVGRLAGPIAAWLLVAAVPVLDVHAMAWSEGAFIALMLAAVAAAAAAFDSGRLGVWIGCGSCLGLAMLTRYAGIALVPAFVWAIARHREWAPSRRLLAAGVLVAAAAVLPAAWVLRNTWLGGAPTDRPFAFHALGAGHLRVLAPLALILGVAALVTGRRAVIVRLAVAMAVSYVALVTSSIAAFDADTSLDTRILVPLLPLALVVVSPWLAAPPGWARAALAFGIAAGVAHGVASADRRGREGDGFNTRYWRDALAEADLGPVPAPVYTNVPEWVAFETGRDTRDVPAHHSRVSLRPRDEYAAEMDDMCEALRAGARLVYFEGVDWRWEIPRPGEISAECHRPATASSDGLHATALTCLHEGSGAAVARSGAAGGAQRRSQGP